ncbi:MAG: septum formation initiator family protein [Acidobacteriia bacterium]|nr:septum formation initiator family protein [Terriglobia bacterium]
MPPKEQIQALLDRHGRTLLMLAALFLLMDDVFGAHGFVAMRRMEKEISLARKEIDRLNTENRDLAEQVKSLRSDPQLIEKIARDELGLVRPGEVIIRIPQAPANGTNKR